MQHVEEPGDSIKHAISVHDRASFVEVVTQGLSLAIEDRELLVENEACLKNCQQNYTQGFQVNLEEEKVEFLFFRLQSLGVQRREVVWRFCRFVQITMKDFDYRLRMNFRDCLGRYLCILLSC